MKPPVLLPPGLQSAVREARQRWDRAWQPLAPREKRLISLAAGLTGLALLWWLALEPAWQTTQRWRTALPQLHAQAAQLDTILREARELRQTSQRGAANPATLTDDLTDSLRRAGLGEVSTVTAESDQWRVQLSAAPVGPTLEWLQVVPFELRVRAATIMLERTTDADGRQLAGRLDGEVLWTLPSGGAR